MMTVDDDDDVGRWMMMTIFWPRGYRIEIVKEGKDRSQPPSKTMPRDTSFTSPAT